MLSPLTTNATVSKKDLQCEETLTEYKMNVVKFIQATVKFNRKVCLEMMHILGNIYFNLPKNNITE